MMFLSILSISLLSLLIGFLAKTPFKTITRKKFSLTNLFHRKAPPLSLCMFFIMIAYGAIIVLVGVYAVQKGFSMWRRSSSVLLEPSFFRVFFGKLFDRGYFFQLTMVGLALTTIGMPWLG